MREKLITGSIFFVIGLILVSVSSRALLKIPFSTFEPFFEFNIWGTIVMASCCYLMLAAGFFVGFWYMVRALSFFMKRRESTLIIKKEGE